MADRVRMDAYHAALAHVIRSTSIVIDLGTGTGIMTALACRLGARHVYAIEFDDSIALAKAIAGANGYASRVEFIQARSTEVSLAELGDVMVSDLRGVLPCFQRHIPSIIDARRRLLKPAGVQIPASDTMWVAVVESPERYERVSGPWNGEAVGLDMTVARAVAVNSWCKSSSTSEQLLTGPSCWARLDYTTVEDADASGEAECVVRRAGTAHGLAVWFDTTLTGEVGFSNAPGEPELIYGHAFFPLEEPVVVQVNDSVAVALRAALVGDDYVWSWDTTVERGGRELCSFHQSTFFGSPLSANKLRKQAATHVPERNEDADIDFLILSSMGRGLSLEAISRLVSGSFPHRFPTWRDVLTRVGALSVTYSR